MCVCLCVCYRHIHTYMNVIIVDEKEAMILKKKERNMEGLVEEKGRRNDVL